MAEVWRAVYRHLVRWARAPRVAEARFELRVAGRSLRSGREVLEAIREGFRGGCGEAAADLDAAFAALRETSAADETIDEVWRRRGMARGEARFGVGSVCRHKLLSYRCVVLGRDHRPDRDVSGWDNVQKTARRDEQPFYKVAPDLRDTLWVMNGYREWLYVAEDNLEPLDEKGVAHPSLPRHFDDFVDGTFVPNPPLAFMYPDDPASRLSNTPSSSSSEEEEVVSALVREVKASIELPDFLEAAPKDGSPCAEFVALYDELETLWLSRAARAGSTSPIPLGSEVSHRLFGFTGIVHGYDLLPRVDVREWDGVRRTRDGANQPFLHVIDGRGAFRYVALENLELLASGREPPPRRALFQHAAGADDAEEPIARAREVLLREALKEPALRLLRAAKFHGEALTAQRLLEIALASALTDEARLLLLEASDALKRGDEAGALDKCDEAILRCPDAAEPYHRLSVCHVHAADYPRAARAARAALEKDPDHLFARSLLGLSLIRQPLPDLRRARDHLALVNDRHPFSDTNLFLYRADQALIHHDTTDDLDDSAPHQAAPPSAGRGPDRPPRDRLDESGTTRS